MKTPQGHVSNVYDLILDSSISIATKFDMTVDHHTLALPFSFLVIYSLGN